MGDYRIISSDSHILELPDLWTSRMEPKFRDRAPHVVSHEDGDWWYTEGVKGQSFGAGAQAGVRFEEPEKLSYKATIENVRPGAYIPEEHIKDMDAEGIDVALIYPNRGLNIYNVQDSELLSAIFRTYNDWLGEFCRPFPRRLKGIAMLNVDDVPSRVKELERCAKMGLTGAMITVYPPETRSYDSPDYEPLWAVAQDLGVPRSLHVGTNRGLPGQEFEHLEDIKAAFMVNIDHWVRMSLAFMIFGGVFERYPKLQVVAVEHELVWVAHFLDRLDYAYTQRPAGDAWYLWKGDMLPSGYFHRNVSLGFQEDAVGLRLRDIIGVDNLLWGSDYPHFESTFPRSRQILDEILADCTDQEKAKIAGGNAARAYHLD